MSLFFSSCDQILDKKQLEESFALAAGQWGMQSAVEKGGGRTGSCYRAEEEPPLTTSGARPES